MNPCVTCYLDKLGCHESGFADARCAPWAEWKRELRQFLGENEQRRKAIEAIKTYRIYNRSTKAWWEGQAPSAQKACAKAGWPMGECWVRERANSPDRYPGWKTVSRLL